MFLPMRKNEEELCLATDLSDLPQFPEWLGGLQSAKGTAQSSNRRNRAIKSCSGQRDLLVVIQDHNHVGIEIASIVHGLISLPRGHGSVPNHSHYVVLSPLEIPSDCHPCSLETIAHQMLMGEGTRNGIQLRVCGIPRAADMLVELWPAPKQSYSLSDRLVNPDKPFVCLIVAILSLLPRTKMANLVADIPKDLVLRSVEDVVESDGKLDHAEAGTEVTAGLGHVEDDIRAELVGELLQLLEERDLKQMKESSGHGNRRKPAVIGGIPERRDSSCGWGS
ncbi:hypothetical protein BHM03_00035154 [Ensete ventricosum]|nr:hypothetical protein BHM03_00035154 [Ensete ventricosum]